MTRRRVLAAGEHRFDVALVALFALACVLVVTLREATGVRGGNDFFREAAPAYDALRHGRLLDFGQLVPLYGGSLALRAPFAMLPATWGGSLAAIYTASVLPCMLLLAAFATWAAMQKRRAGHSWPARIATVLCCTFTPYVAIVARDGHPEELVSSVLCIAALLVAIRGRTTAAALLVGAAVVNKPWALVAAPLVILSLPAGRRRAVLIAGASVAAILGPLLLLRNDQLVASVGGAAADTTFLPPQLLWWLGPHSVAARWAHPLIVVVAAAVALTWYLLRRRGEQPAVPAPQDALLVLSLIFLLRAALDPLNNVYYAIPFLFALFTYEVLAGRAPLLMLACGGLLWIAPQLPYSVSANFRASVYAVTIVPMIVTLAARVFLPDASQALWARLRSAMVVRRPSRTHGRAPA